jgi:hypothetical protein
VLCLRQACSAFRTKLAHHCESLVKANRDRGLSYSRAVIAWGLWGLRHGCGFSRNFVGRGCHHPARDCGPGPHQMAAPNGAFKWRPRTGLSWEIEHFVGYFVATTILLLAWPRPLVVGGALMCVAGLLESLQALTLDHTRPIMWLHYTERAGHWPRPCLPSSSFALFRARPAEPGRSHIEYGWIATASARLLELSC